jgi:DNA-binding MarR family transcriptional regulator
MGSISVEVSDDEFLQEGEREFVNALSAYQSISEVAKSSGLSPRIVAGVVRSLRIMLHANDGHVDDFLDLVESWNAGGLEGFIFSHKNSSEDDHVRFVEEPTANEASLGTADFRPRKQAALEEFERDWSPQEVRDLGESLLRLADSIDQGWTPQVMQFSFDWLSAHRQIERNSLELAKKAILIKRQISMRKSVLPEALLGEPTWNMLLELFCQFAGGASVSTKSLCIAADCPDSTALRHIERLEEVGLIRRFRSQTDGRVILAELTKRGVVSVGRVLERITI